MAIKVEFKGQLLSPELLKNLESQVKKALGEIAGDMKDQIVRRTQSGEEIEGGGFKKYSKSYAEFKKESGRPSDPPNLTFSGNMLQSIQTRVNEAGSGKYIAEIGFSNAVAEKKARENQFRRPFFGFSKKQEREIKERLEKLIDLKEANK